MIFEPRLPYVPEFAHHTLVIINVVITDFQVFDVVFDIPPVVAELLPRMLLVLSRVPEPAYIIGDLNAVHTILEHYKYYRQI